MRKFMQRGILAIALLAVSVGMLQAQEADREQVEAIQKATFTTLEGEAVSLSDFEGKLVLIDFWETWCAPCLKSFKDMQKVKEEYPDRFVVLAVNPNFADEPEDVRQFVEENDYDFVFVHDTDELHKTLGVRSLPYKVFMDPDGNYIETDIGSLAEDYQHIKELITQHTSAVNDTQ